MTHNTDITSDALPWARVPALKAVRTMLCGEETIEKCRVKAEPLIAELEQVGLGGTELKSRMLTAPRANKILPYLLSKLVMRFGKFEHRREWVVGMLNDEREDTELATLQNADEIWEFSEQSLTQLLRRYALDGKSNTQRPAMDRAYELIWKEHDGKGISVAAKFLKGLGARRKARS